MSSESRCCLILKPGVTRTDFEQVVRRLEFVHSETYPSDANRLAHEELWCRPDLTRPTAVVNYVESPLSELNYLFVRAVDLDQTMDELTSQLAIFSHQQLVDDALHATSHNDQVRAIVRLAMAFVDYDPTIFGIIGTFATRAENPVLREAAINAIGFRNWSQFRPLVETVAKRDLDRNVRQRAALVLQYWPPTSA